MKQNKRVNGCSPALKIGVTDLHNCQNLGFNDHRGYCLEPARDGDGTETPT